MSDRADAPTREGENEGGNIPAIPVLPDHRCRTSVALQDRHCRCDITSPVLAFLGVDASEKCLRAASWIGSSMPFFPTEANFERKSDGTSVCRVESTN